MLSNKIKMLIALCFALYASVSEAVSISDVRVAELPGERAEIRISFDATPDQPAGYTIERPARIVLDFVGAGNILDKKKFPIAVGDVSSAVVITGGGRTRVIVNLDQLVPYAGRIEGSDYIVEVGSDVPVSSDQPAFAGAVSTEQPESKAFVAGGSNTAPQSASISSVDFRRGEVGEGRVIIDLSSPKVAVDVEEVSSGVRVKFIDTFLPSELKRTLDVIDFATPVKSFAAATSGRDATILISTSGEYDYLAYQADNRYVISVKPLTRQELEEKKKKFAYIGETLSLNFQDIEVRSVLQLIADFTELNLVASDTVSGRITLRLDNVPWDQALDLVLKTKGLDKRQIGNVLMVAPAAEIAERERQEIETKKQLQELAPLRTEYLRIRYANAAELFKLFAAPEGGGQGQGESTGSLLSERGQAIVDERTNSIILTDTDERIQEFKALVDRIDIPIRQVMIEARIVRANDDFRKELGINLTASGSDTSPSGSTLHSANAGVNAGFAAPTGTFGWDIINADFLINLELLALEEVGLAEIVSQPKVITGDKQSATIESGTEVAYQEESASGGTTTQFKEVLLKLDVTPQITPDGRVIMDLEITQDNVASITATGIPVLDVTGLTTQVLVSNGETVVLGGVYQTETVDGERKVPLLGDIPFLGKLFRSDVVSENKSELLIFITPRIMDSIYADQ